MSSREYRSMSIYTVMMVNDGARDVLFSGAAPDKCTCCCKQITTYTPINNPTEEH